MFELFEIFAIFVAVGAIATLARGRGASPVVMGSIAAVGWVLIKYGGLFFLRSGEYAYPLMLAAWIWVALVGGYVRFVVGASRPKPDGRWNCANCRFFNEASSVICEACQQPWQPPAS